MNHQIWATLPTWANSYTDLLPCQSSLPLAPIALPRRNKYLITRPDLVVRRELPIKIAASFQEKLSFRLVNGCDIYSLSLSHRCTHFSCTCSADVLSLCCPFGDQTQNCRAVHGSAHLHSLETQAVYGALQTGYAGKLTTGYRWGLGPGLGLAFVPTAYHRGGLHGPPSISWPWVPSTLHYPRFLGTVSCFSSKARFNLYTVRAFVWYDSCWQNERLAH